MDLDVSSCTDENNAVVPFDTGTSCSINAELPAIEDPAYVKGHIGLGETAADNVMYE
jgi:hypothetical protein